MSRFFRSTNKSYPAQNVSIANSPRGDLAIKYRVEDLTGALLPGSFLSKILDQLELGESLSDLTLQQLQKKGFNALLRYAKGELWFQEYTVVAHQEQLIRRQESTAKLAKENAERKLKEAEQQKKIEQTYAATQRRVEARQRKIENDPRSIAKLKQNALREKYNLEEYIESADFPKLMDILKRADSGQQLTKDDLLWLKTDGEEYFTRELRERYHLNEAEFYANDFRESKNSWSAVNASSSYRKCKKASTAEQMLNSLNIENSKDIHLKSAVFTTHGGVKRDLRDFEAALKFGEQAHKLTPKDLRPCTLLGAVHWELGNYDLGKSWYDKAEERGASKKSVDDDLRRIILLSEKPKQLEMCNFLLRSNPDRFFWVEKILSKISSHR